MKLRLFVMAIVSLVTAGLVACGGDDGVQPDPTVAAFVGTWEADSMVMINPADTSVHDNLIAQGGGFTLVVEPSGQYTATLDNSLGPAPAVEIGDLDVLGGSSLQLNATYPKVATAVTSYSFVGDDRLILDGETDYDFNRDGTPETARGYIELQRQ